MKLFDLYIQGNIIIRQRPMSFVMAMKNKLSKQPHYKGCKFEIKFNK